jgi:trigger factor
VNRAIEGLLTQWLVVKTTLEELPESRVRLEVEVPEADVRHAFEHAASDLAGSVRVPGFRKGKAPVRVIMARLGREAIWQEALRSHLDGWFWNAAETSGIQPVANPELEFEDIPTDGGPFVFTATVAVVPKPEVGDWTTLDVPAAEPDVPVEVVDHELDRVRETVAELVPVEDRPVRAGDAVVIDLTGEGVPTQLDYVTEVGEGRLVDEIDEALVGMSLGERKAVELRAGDETQAIEVEVKEIKEKALPALDDELARAASEFDTLAELRDDIGSRLREQLAAETEARFREDAADALVAASQVEPVEPLVERRTAELWVGIARSLERRGISVEMYLSMTGQSQEEVVARLRAEAERSLARELVLDAVADKLGLEVSDEEVDELVREQADESGEDPAEVLGRLRDSDGGRVYAKLKGDLRLKKALDEVVAGVNRIPVDLARAREKLWTPEKEKGGPGMKIWTPGSEEAKR